MAPPTRTTPRLNLFLEPTPACSFAVSAAAEIVQGFVEYELQSVPNPDVSRIGVSCVDADTMMLLMVSSDHHRLPNNRIRCFHLDGTRIRLPLAAVGSTRSGR